MQRDVVLAFGVGYGGGGDTQARRDLPLGGAQELAKQPESLPDASHRSEGMAHCEQFIHNRTKIKKLFKNTVDMNELECIVANVSNAREQLPEVLTIEEVASLLRISTSTVRKMAKTGRIPAIRLSSSQRRLHFRFSRAAIMGMGTKGTVSSTAASGTPDQNGDAETTPTPSGD